MDENAIQPLRDLKERLRGLRAEHDQAASRFRANQAFGDVLVGIGSRWVEETFDFPSSEARKAAAKLRARWKESPDYGQLESKYNGLENEVREALHNATKRPTSLRRVREAILLPTKIARLEAMVDEVIERLERPPSPKPPRKRATRAPTRSSLPRPPQPMTLPDVVGVVGSAASIVSLILYVVTQPFSLLVASTLGLVTVLFGVAVVLSIWRRMKRQIK